MGKSSQEFIAALRRNFDRWPRDFLSDEPFGGVELDDRERRLLFLRFGADLDQRETAGLLMPNKTLSQQMVSKIERTALAKIRATVAPKSRPTDDTLPRPGPAVFSSTFTTQEPKRGSARRTESRAGGSAARGRFTARPS